MASIILKKRKLCEAIEQGLQITPASYEMKKRIDEHGEYKQLYESILPQLKVLFPDLQDIDLSESLKANNNDIISTIEYLNYHKTSTPMKNTFQLTEDLDENILKTLDQLSQCQNRDQAYQILNRFKNEVVDGNDKKKLKLDAENCVLRKAFKIQKKILVEESLKRQNSEEMLVSLAKELETSKLLNRGLIIRLNQLEMNCNQDLRDDHIY